MVSVKSLFVAVLALAGDAAAHRTFHNKGIINGWDMKYNSSKGTITEDKEIVYKGKTSLKLTQTYDDRWFEPFRTELEVHEGYKRGDQRFYAFVFRLPENWEFVDQETVISEFVSNRHGKDACGDVLMPGTMLWLKGNKLYTRLLSGPYKGNDCNRKIVDYPDLFEVVPGKWHKVVMYAKWESGRRGNFKLWIDGRKVLHKRGIANTVSGDWNFQFRVGMYMPKWHDEGKMEGKQSHREMWFDEIAIGTEAKNADPDELNSDKS